MQDMSDQTTIFYRLKLKRTKTPMEVLEKMQKSVKKKSATRNWICTIDSSERSMTVDFGDEKSETFRLSFDDNKVCESSCKVFFPLSGELFDDEKKSEFKSLINMIYSVRTSFAEMKITDDYGISESFIDSKVNKIALRELTEDETKRAERLFADGYTSIKEFITALMYNYREIPYSEDFIPYINRRIGGSTPIMFWDQCDSISDFFRAFADSFLYETTEYQDKGRLYTVDDYYCDLNGVFFSVTAFVMGLEVITGYQIHEKGWDPKSTQVLRLYYNKFLPLIEAEEADFRKCVLSYRFFVSIMDYLGFKYVGKGEKYNDLIDESLANSVKAMLNEGDHRTLEKAVHEFVKKYD
jgi:hypothetical protein